MHCSLTNFTQCPFAGTMRGLCGDQKQLFIVGLTLVWTDFLTYFSEKFLTDFLTIFLAIFKMCTNLVTVCKNCWTEASNRRWPKSSSTRPYFPRAPNGRRTQRRGRHQPEPEVAQARQLPKRLFNYNKITSTISIVVVPTIILTCNFLTQKGASPLKKSCRNIFFKGKS